MGEPTLRVGADRLDEAVAVLAESFFDYPTMRYLLGDDDANYDRRLASLIRHFTRGRIETGLVLAIESEGRLVAVALVDPPGTLLEEESLDPALIEELGQGTLSRLADFDTSITRLEPYVCFFYVGMVGVVPDFRGRGLAGRLFDEVAVMSVSHPESAGVLLTTEHEANLGLYAGLGFELVGDTWTSDGVLRSWTLFRADA